MLGVSIYALPIFESLGPCDQFLGIGIFEVTCLGISLV